MKQIYAACLILLMLFSFSSCNDEEVKYRIGVSQCSGGPWREKQNSEMQRELLLHEGIQMEQVSADDDSKKQISDIQHFIDEKVDIIVVSPNQDTDMVEIISKAYKSGVPVLLFDRHIEGEDFTAYVGGDNIDVGRQLALFARKHLPQGGNVVEIKGAMDTSPARQRHEGFISGLSASEDIHLVASLDAAWDGPRGARMLKELLRQRSDIDVVVAHSDWMASEAKAAVDSMNPGRKIRFVGVDGFGDYGYGVYALERGEIDGTVIYPTGGATIIQTAIDILEGRKYDRNTLLPGYLITDSKEARMLIAMNDEMENEGKSIIQLRDLIIFYVHQHETEQMALFSTVALLILAVIFIITFWRMYTTKRNANKQLHHQQAELQEQHDQLLKMTRELEAATNAKLVFFTNVSHDFRTPLTLISAPVETVTGELEKMMESGDRRQEADNNSQLRNSVHLLHIAQRNVKVLLGLINQILDFRKCENGKMTLNLQQADLGHYMRQWVEAFRQYGKQKGIDITLSCDRTPDWNLMVDIMKLEGMIYNLIGNAMKYTPRGGTITVSCLRDASEYSITIADTGCGIDEEHIRHIFERFYQINSGQHEGSGIGLALVRNLVALMHGTIDIQSNADTSLPTGTTVTMRFPVEQEGNVSRLPSSSVYNPSSFTLPPSPIIPAQTEEVPVVTEDETRQVLLVIDDNPDILSFIKTLLGSKYRVITATDGQQGLKVARETVPDIILCDVMMPVMDGLECCRHLKEDIRTSHIPVLMLTACSLDEQRVQGLTEGAEAYLSKPFSVSVLTAQIDTMLRNRTILKSSGKSPEDVSDAGRPESPKLEALSLGSEDKDFVEKMQKKIIEKVGDTDFNVEILASEMCMSRVQLYRKCKAITGITPVEMVRNVRLEKGRELLSAGNTTISAVAKAVGFADPAYFARCYKSYFGISAKAKG